ncbi:MAG: ATP-binding cassette domain-containing protein [Bifidobacteriaceae bacterium]|jgi:energy-coupling factor transport system ATP-binding protein|nr:ATP-binding cassette domain-containing protein [Bifidobacteriaceae bacterium]
MIRFTHVTIRYTGAHAPVLRDVTLHLGEGEFALVTGPTGSGKSTLLGAASGHVPHFTGGTVSGHITVGGLDTRDHRPRDLAHLVGVVRQNPLAGFVADTVEAELAYGMERLGVPPRTMRTRVEETLDLLGIADLRHRTPGTLSGGQAGRAAIAAVLAAGARILILDEPTSALDPGSTEEVLAALLRLVHDTGVTALVAEHRLERVLDYADRLVVVDAGRVRSGPPADLIADAPLAPPVVELGRLLGWHPLPLSVRDARRAASRAALPARLRSTLPGDHAADAGPHLPAEGRARGWPAPPGHGKHLRSGARGTDDAGLGARGIDVDYGRVRAVRGVALHLPPGRITALMGRNGSGKSSLLWALAGARAPNAGTWFVNGVRLDGAGRAARLAAVRLVPQEASDLLYLDAVEAECAEADTASGAAPGTCRGILDRLTPGISPAMNPSDVSEGQRLALVLAIQLTANAPVLLLDEPTRGLDYTAKSALGVALAGLAARGRVICVATHDVEFAAGVADWAVVMASGEVIADGPAGEVLAGSTVFAPQVAKVLAPTRLLTVAQVAAALDGAP